MRRGVRPSPLPESTLVPHGFQGKLSIEQELSRDSPGNSGRNPGGRPGEDRGQSATPASPRIRWYRTGSRGNSQGSCRYPGKAGGSAGGLGSRPLPPPREYGSAEPATVGLPVDCRRGRELPGGSPGRKPGNPVALPSRLPADTVDAVEAVRASGEKLPADGGRGRGGGRDPRGD